MAEIKSAVFVKSSTDIGMAPEADKPEYIFIGRSNVGKSSLINNLTGNKKLAKTSSTPGKTQLINHFLINDSYYIVDLPGYGYAKTSKKQRAKFHQFITDYIKKRSSLMCVLVLLDCRHAPLAIDLDFMAWLGGEQIPFVMVFTKIDKLSSSALNKNMLHYKKEMLKQWESLPQIFHSSAETGIGKSELIHFMEKTNAFF